MHFWSNLVIFDQNVIFGPFLAQNLNLISSGIFLPFLVQVSFCFNRNYLTNRARSMFRQQSGLFIHIVLILKVKRWTFCTHYFDKIRSSVNFLNNFTSANIKLLMLVFLNWQQWLKRIGFLSQTDLFGLDWWDFKYMLKSALFLTEDKSLPILKVG